MLRPNSRSEVDIDHPTLTGHMQDSGVLHVVTNTCIRPVLAFSHVSSHVRSTNFIFPGLHAAKGRLAWAYFLSPRKQKKTMYFQLDSVTITTEPH